MFAACKQILTELLGFEDHIISPLRNMRLALVGPSQKCRALSQDNSWWDAVKIRPQASCEKEWLGDIMPMTNCDNNIENIENSCSDDSLMLEGY